MNADCSRMRTLVEDGSSPTWSPSGDRILFTAEGEPEGTRIFVRWMDDEGAITPITRLENSPGNVEWSPDGQHRVHHVGRLRQPVAHRPARAP